LKSQID